MSQRPYDHDALQSPFLPLFTLARSSLAKFYQSGSHPAIRNARISILLTRQPEAGKMGRERNWWTRSVSPRTASLACVFPMTECLSSLSWVWECEGEARVILDE